jgi:hypothetical protein
VSAKAIRERDSWEFVEHVDASGRPIWTKDIARRGEVFRYPGHCERVDAVYHPVPKRYLLAVSYGHGGGWGIYDAPEPWGPWTTAFQTENWKLGGTHGYRLPSKWLDVSGTRGHLVFSGVDGPAGKFDAFCVRGMEWDRSRK